MAATSTVGNLLDFAAPVLINMADRPRRLRDSLTELARAAQRPKLTADDVDIIRPTVFDDPAGFTNTAFRSNFDAHLRIARWALASDHERVLVLEDDIAFHPQWQVLGPPMLTELLDQPWHLATLGYQNVYHEAPQAAGPDEAPSWVRFSQRVDGAHAYLLHRDGLASWVEHLSAIWEGEPGDPVRGPMASDGAINTFTWADPSRIRLLAVPNLVGTRPTRSDITPSPYDRLPLVRTLAEETRRLVRWVDPGRANF
jgi:hypothetical protein